jgi:hypothetical protein
MIRLILAAAAAVLPMCAAASEVVLHLGSRHGDRIRGDGEPYVERNPGVGVRFGNVQFGAYRNSWGKGSAYALADFEPVKVGPVSAGVFVGAATGYPGKAVLPAAGALCRIRFGDASVTLRVVPPLGGSSGVAAVEVGWRLI